MTLFFGILPIKLPAFRSNKKLLSFSNCFSGGLFLAIGLVHLLPEAVEAFEDKESTDDHGHSFPWAYFITICSFSVILLIDKVFFNTADQLDNEESKDLQISVVGNKDGTIEENFSQIVSHQNKLAN